VLLDLAPRVRGDPAGAAPERGTRVAQGRPVREDDVKVPNAEAAR